MKYEDTAKGFLRQIRKLDALIKNKIAEREQWKAIALGTSMQLNERVQFHGNQQKMAHAVEKYIDIEKEIDQCIDDLIAKKQEVISVIEQLKASEYDILHKVYVQNLTLEEAAYSCDKSYSWSTSIHGRALKNLQNILDERKEVTNETSK